jgi:hypothetical protein
MRHTESAQPRSNPTCTKLALQQTKRTKYNTVQSLKLGLSSSPHAADNHLQHWASVSTQQVDLINDQQANLWTHTAKDRVLFQLLP